MTMNDIQMKSPEMIIVTESDILAGKLPLGYESLANVYILSILFCIQLFIYHKRVGEAPKGKAPYIASLLPLKVNTLNAHNRNFHIVILDVTRNEGPKSQWYTKDSVKATWILPICIFSRAASASDLLLSVFFRSRRPAHLTSIVLCDQRSKALLSYLLPVRATSTSNFHCIMRPAYSTP